ncbi:hypothetical protein HanXRQr2_Chr02g0056021 [Helianthus annuus]|uniref:Uncharacterized protein n=1 Tax=Helianthus annuus TaxID=4232 RepID=A0A9K3JL62_HELAN|nr:hypothetical protein HanXRQr2_Chr02g0056021 [Helianthus annuus]KAJ0614535.1 hypothetical protein HanIR_Chr02g0063541 [Helianthus annuus]KAJ0618128.1 hypothetical protein HanHA89_Chr02g0049661 [Helianthus annuus]KAJ0951037.1 hypothetical protein HanPSC8_Chr02g0055281 [Helianthus annuus]
MHPHKCTVLKTSSQTFSDLAFDDKVAVECLLWWKAYLQNVLLEKAGWYLEPFTESKLSSHWDVFLF